MEADLSGLFISVCGAILSTVLHSLEHPVVHWRSSATCYSWFAAGFMLASGCVRAQRKLREGNKGSMFMQCVQLALARLDHRQSASHPASQHASQLASQLASQPVCQPASQTSRFV